MIPEFTDLDYEHYATLLDGISDLDVLFGDDLLKPEQHCLSNSSTVAPIAFSMLHAPHAESDQHYEMERVWLARLAEEAMSAASALKD